MIQEVFWEMLKELLNLFAEWISDVNKLSKKELFSLKVLLAIVVPLLIFYERLKRVIKKTKVTGKSKPKYSMNMYANHVFKKFKNASYLLELARLFNGLVKKEDWRDDYQKFVSKINELPWEEQQAVDLLGIWLEKKTLDGFSGK